MIDNITIDFFLSFENITSIENTRRECNLMVNLLKFTYNKKILSGVVVIGYKLVYGQTLSYIKYVIRCFNT